MPKNNDNMQLYPKLITDALEKVIYPGTKKNLVESEMLADSIRIDGNKVSFTLIFPRDTDPFMQSTIKAIVRGAKTGETGDGKIFILDLKECVRIRTEERGSIAIG